MLTAKAAADRAGVSVSLIYELCKSGALRHSRFGRPGRRGCIRISETDLSAYLETCKREGGVATEALGLRHITPIR